MPRSIAFFRSNLQKIEKSPSEWGGFRVKIGFFGSLVKSIGFITKIIQACLFLMSEVSGFCLKCKTYGPIKDGKMIVMSNGRTRCAGFCSQDGCTGKISKIVS